MNKVIITGCVAGTYEGNNNIRVSMAVTERVKGENKSIFIPCVAFGGTADFIRRNFNVGTFAEIEGRLNIYKTEDGVYITNVVIDEIGFCGAKRQSKQPTDNEIAWEPMQATDNSDLPF